MTISLHPGITEDKGVFWLSSDKNVTHSLQFSKQGWLLTGSSLHQKTSKKGEDEIVKLGCSKEKKSETWKADFAKSVYGKIFYGS